jgi:pimeloyl-ACP methyl ester carboxylesterase
MDVVGLVLVDPAHEREFERIDALLTAEQRAAGTGMRPMSSENFDIEAVFAEVQSISDTHLPVSIVARGRPLAREEVPPAWSASQYVAREQLRQALQRELAQRFPNGRLVIAPQSGHFVHHDAPDLVIAEIRRIVTSWRSNGAT